MTVFRALPSSWRSSDLGRSFWPWSFCPEVKEQRAKYKDQFIVSGFLSVFVSFLSMSVFVVLFCSFGRTIQTQSFFSKWAVHGFQQWSLANGFQEKQMDLVPFWYHFGVGAPPKLVYFCGNWDVHWGYGLLTHGHVDKGRFGGQHLGAGFISTNHF